MSKMLNGKRAHMFETLDTIISNPTLFITPQQLSP